MDEEDFLIGRDEAAERREGERLLVAGAASTIFLMSGHTSAGKTFFATRLARASRLPLLHTYQIRQALFPQLRAPSDFQLASAAYQASVGAVYDRLLEEARLRLSHGRHGVVLDGSFPFHRLRLPFYQLGEEFGAEICVVRCCCPDPYVVARRLEERTRDASLPPVESARDRAVYESSLSESEPPDSDALQNRLTLVGYDSCRVELVLPEGCSARVRRMLEGALRLIRGS